MSSPLVTDLLDFSLTQSSGGKRNLQLKIRKPSDQILSLHLAANNLLEKSVFRGMWNLGKPVMAYTSLPCRVPCSHRHPQCPDSGFFFFFFTSTFSNEFFYVRDKALY